MEYTLNEFGLINAAIFSPRSNQLLQVMTDSGSWHVSYSSEDSLILEKTGETFFYEGKLHLDSYSRYCDEQCLYIRPGFELETVGYAFNPKLEELELRLGSDIHRLHRDKLENREHVSLEGFDLKHALKKANLTVVDSFPCSVSSESYIEEWDENHGSLIYNRITGFHQIPPDSDRALDDGFYWSERYSEWMGAAIDSESEPIEELKLFFALLKPAQRLELARRLQDDSLNVGISRYTRHSFGLRFMDHSAIEIDALRGLREDDVEEELLGILEEAVHYLCTLRPGATTDQSQAVLKALQEVETGLELRKLPESKIDGWSIVTRGGPRSIAGENHGTRLLQILGMKESESKPLQELQSKWASLEDHLKWEASHIGLIAADYGITIYSSRRKLANAFEKRRLINLKDAQRYALYLQEQRDREEQRATKRAARRDDDTFAISECETEGFHRLEVLRDDQVVETYSICQEGTRIFCKRSGVDSSRRYSRSELACAVEHLIENHKSSDWLHSHNFIGLFDELGLAPKSA